VYITPGYFETLQIPVLIGRSFTEQDGPNSQRVAIVNRAFMRKLFHGANPVGRYVDNNTVIVGVVEDVAITPGLVAGAPRAGEQAMYIPAAQVDAQLLSVVHAYSSTVGLSGLPVQFQRLLRSCN